MKQEKPNSFSVEDMEVTHTEVENIMGKENMKELFDLSYIGIDKLVQYIEHIGKLEIIFLYLIFRLNKNWKKKSNKYC